MRIYQPTPFSEGEVYPLAASQSHHVSQVLRATVGDAITLFNGLGGEYHGVIQALTKKQVMVEMLQFDPIERESPVSLHLAQAVAKSDKMDFIIQKAVELGVTEMTPLIAARCQGRLDQEKTEKREARWRSIIISACEQSGRNRLPRLNPTVMLETWLPTANEANRWVLSPGANTSLVNEVSEGAHALIVGPEGGLTDQEVSLAIQAGFKPWLLGPRVLRTETASLAALSVLQDRYGDYR